MNMKDLGLVPSVAQCAKDAKRKNKESKNPKENPPLNRHNVLLSLLRSGAAVFVAVKYGRDKGLGQPHSLFRGCFRRQGAPIKEKGRFRNRPNGADKLL